MADIAPLVSIVIPARNHARYLPQAVRSALGQDYPRVELIVLDDGSTDNTREVLARLPGAFRWESHGHMGQAQTQNKGWQMARGEILAYLSADDTLASGAVAAAVSAFAATPEAVATYCDFELIDPASRVIRTVRAPAFDYSRLAAELECAPGPGAFFRRAAWERAGGWNPVLRQMPDYDFWLRLGLQGPFVHIPRVLAQFRVHAASQTFSRATEVLADEPQRIIGEFFARADLPDDIRVLHPRALAKANLVSAQLHFRAGRWRRAFQRLRAARAAGSGHIGATGSFRLAVNALFNRAGHRALWTLRDLFS
ncbi:MAG TPA: glycosyltransferase [Burkholderiales bacterium]|nr:glycosyltransferase [Burkholderiales bacterium]